MRRQLPGTRLQYVSAGVFSVLWAVVAPSNKAGNQYRHGRKNCSESFSQPANVVFSWEAFSVLFWNGGSDFQAWAPGPSPLLLVGAHRPKEGPPRGCDGLRRLRSRQSPWFPASQASVRGQLGARPLCVRYVICLNTSLAFLCSSLHPPQTCSNSLHAIPSGGAWTLPLNVDAYGRATHYRRSPRRLSDAL